MIKARVLTIHKIYLVAQLGFPSVPHSGTPGQPNFLSAGGLFLTIRSAKIRLRILANMSKLK